MNSFWEESLQKSSLEISLWEEAPSKWPLLKLSLQCPPHFHLFSFLLYWFPNDNFIFICSQTESLHVLSPIMTILVEVIMCISAKLKAWRNRERRREIERESDRACYDSFAKRNYRGKRRREEDFVNLLSWLILILK